MDKPNFKLKKGDICLIKGIKVIVLTADYYSNDGGWYIECHDVKNGLYRYYKQIYDGGDVTKVTK